MSNHISTYSSPTGSFQLDVPSSSTTGFFRFFFQLGVSMYSTSVSPRSHYIWNHHLVKFNIFNEISTTNPWNHHFGRWNPIKIPLKSHWTPIFIPLNPPFSTSHSPVWQRLGPLGRPAGRRFLGGRQWVLRQAAGDEPLQPIVADLAGGAGDSGGGGEPWADEASMLIKTW